MSPRKIAPVVLVLVLVNLFASAAYALPPSSRQGVSHTEGVIAAAWEWLGSLLNLAVGKPDLRGDREKAGSSMDPNGSPQGSSDVSDTTSDAGSHMDPDGYK